MSAATNALFSPTDQRMHRVFRVEQALLVRHGETDPTEDPVASPT